MKRIVIIAFILCATTSFLGIATPQSSTIERGDILCDYLDTSISNESISNLDTTIDTYTSAQYAHNTATEQYDDEIEIIPAKKKKSKKKKSFNSPKTKNFWGFTLGYTSKNWRKRLPTGEESTIYFEDGKNLHGIQIGIRFNPLFKYGFGIDTGLYYEYYHYRYTLLQEESEEGNKYLYKTLNEHIVRIPLHLEYRLNFSRSFQLFIFGGITADYIIYGSMSTSNQNNLNSTSETITDIYGTTIPSESRFNIAWSFGGGIRFGAIQFNVTSTRGFLNCTPNKEYIIEQDNPLNISMSVMF